jgi:von Willebrand factor type A domain
MAKAPATALVLGTIGILAIACGSSQDSQFEDPRFAEGNQSGGGGPGFGNGGGPGTVTPGSACATSSGASNAPPLRLVFMFDRSGSMEFNPKPNNKWSACTTGLKSFFRDPSSQNLYAALQVFPDTSDQCSVSAYQNYLVPETPLPDTAGKLAAALDANGPQKSYETPTLPALKGAIAYAQSVQAQLTGGEKVAVVLVTDGEPNACNSTAQAVADEAAKVAGTIPTYVIGIGSLIANLDLIARGGGTGKAIMVSDSNPAQITPDFEAAVGQIKNQALGCEYSLPKPPNGQTLDINAVNVNYTPGGGGPQTLQYSKDCSNPNGWHYDNTSTPQHVEMCPGICDTLKKDTGGGKLDVIFGCKTAGDVTR